MNKLVRNGREGAIVLSPSLGLLTSHLTKAMHQATMNMDATSWNLIQDVLQYAADVERTISGQRERIAHLESLSVTDELTGLPNRRGLNSYLENAASSAKRYNEQGLVAFIDLDGFKAINDTFGHEAGDLVLIKVANILSEHIRTSDFAARLGGDEFVVVLDRSDLEKGTERLATLHHNLDTATITYKGQRIAIRASMGTAHYNEATNHTELLVIADKAMYNEKAHRSQILARN